MKTAKNILSQTRLNRLRAQGYTAQSDEILSDMSFGIRFAYRTCVCFILVAMATESIALFSAMLCITMFGVILPKHPFDYVYNATLSKVLNKPKLGERSAQLKFACTIASIWVATIVILLSIELTTAALVLAGMLAFTAFLPATIDYCIPSVIYNLIFTEKVRIINQ